MDIVLDIGNTRRKVGAFEGRSLKEVFVATGWRPAELVRRCNQLGAGRVFMSSVVEDDWGWREALQAHFDFCELTHHTPLPFENRYATPQTLGKDRLAAAAGAAALWPGESCLVVDCGTCIKYDFIEAGATYWGGNISPGAAMRAKAMHEYTARLPLAEMGMPASFVGHSTATALQNGAFRGALLEIEGFAKLFFEKYGHLRVCLTGGDAAFFQPLLTSFETTVEPHLVLHGLQHISLHLSRNGFEQR